MAIQIVSTNLNTYGNNGQFETDPSTWGFQLSFYTCLLSRSNAQKSAGLYSLKAVYQSAQGTSDPQLLGLFGRAQLSNNRKYVVRCKVYVPSSNPIGPDGMVLTLGSYNGGVTVNKTVLQCKDNWQDLEIRFQFPYPGYVNETFGMFITHNGNFALSPNDGGEIYVDQYEVYEYTDVPDVCTLKVDALNSVIVNDTSPGAGNGSITVATYQGSGPFQFSKNNGAWQSSNVFPGLIAGNYIIKVREVNNNSCTDQYAFTVNNAPPTFDFATVVSHETFPGFNDGSIIINVTGSTAPYQYSKNGGGNYQSVNSFYNLAPGQYLITVKDAGGVILSKFITIEAGTISFEKAYFSKNFIPFTVNALLDYTGRENYRIYCDTRVEDVAGSSVFTSKLRQWLKPTTAGNAVFNLRQAFRNVFRAIPPEYNTNGLTILTDRIKRFINYTGHLEDDQIVPDVLTASNPFLVLMGGVGKYHYPTLNFFTTYLTQTKKFLTWAPTTKAVDKDQEDYLTFFVYAPLILVVELKAKIYYEDGTNATYSITGASGIKNGDLLQLPAGPLNAQIIDKDLAKIATHYELWLVDQNQSVISEVRTYNIVKDKLPNTRFFMIYNSLGGYEVHRFYGLGEVEETYDSTLVQKFLPLDYDPLEGEMEVNQRTGQRSFSYSSGYFEGEDSAQWLDYMRDLLRTPKFFNVTNGDRVPMIITSKKLALEKDKVYERFVRIEAMEAYENETYTPDLV